ncbi:MAG TPA: ABC transporter permease [Vicinamibacterales bacterium]|nr:ABC transporter permease [Vicinamibacterales bacterium]
MQDLRDAIRALRATPVITVVAILSLALGIGANTAIFSILDTLLLRALPVRAPERLAMVSIGADDTSLTNPIWEQIRARPELFDGAFAFGSARFDLAQGGQTEFVDGIWSSAGMFDALGVRPILGRTFVPDDDRRGGGADGVVAVISYDFWQRRFNGAADTVGRTITIQRVPFAIVGITPPSFFGPAVGRTFDIAVPIGAEPAIRGRDSTLDRRSTWWLTTLVRLKEGQSIEAASGALRGVQPQIREATLPEDWRPQDLESYLKETFQLRPAATGVSGLRARYERPLQTLMVVVGLVLVIACANIANLLLARASARRRELSVRLALGASRLRLARQLLAESLLLSGVGALAGLALAKWGSELLVSQLSTQTSRVFLDLSLDWRVLAFTAAVTIATAILFGVAPAWRAARVAPSEAMTEQSRGVIGEGRTGLRNTLVVVQVALSLVLVVAAGLFVRTFTALADKSLGFDRDPVLIVSVNAQRSEAAPEERSALYERVRQAVAAVPGVASAAASVVSPVSGSSWQYAIEIPDRPDLPEASRGVYVNLVTPDWFKTYGTALIAGRDFNAHDRLGAADVVIVNETMASRLLGTSTPVGRTIRTRGRPGRPARTHEVVGYVRDAVYRSLRDPVPATIYLPLAQQDEIPSSITISLRAGTVAPATLARSVTAAISAVDRNVALTTRPLADQVNAALIQERLLAMLAGFFGALALLLAGVGLYGVTSYAVGRRRTEIGIRMALGAVPRRVLGLVLRRVAILVTLGVIVGTGVSVWASRYVSTLLFGLEPRDPVTLAGAALVLGAIGALAGWVPALRASRIDPARVLREG